MSGLGGLFGGKNSFNFTTADVVKVAKSAAIVGVGAALAYALNGLSLLDWGPSTPLVVAGLAWAANTIKVWVSDSSK